MRFFFVIQVEMQILHFAFIAAGIYFVSAELNLDDPICGPPLEVEHSQPNVTKDDHPVGSEISYICDFGYLTEGNLKSSRCVLVENEQRAEWTEPKITCMPRSCGDPGFVPNAQQIGFLFTFPHEVQFQCDEGYKLIGPDKRFCLASGQWSGKLPYCQRINCNRPKDPENGQAVYSSLEYGSVLRYTCDKGYILSNKEPRTCSEDGTWTGSEGACNEGRCDFPQAPAFGSVELLGAEPKIGSIAVYSCDPGRTLNGAEKAKCQETGEWNVDAPECLEPCKALQVDHGRIGRYVPRRRYSNQLIFEKIAIGTLLKDGEKLFLHCDSGYDPAGTTDWQKMFICREGRWSDDPRCEPAACRVTPPGTRNTAVVSINETHGGKVTYMCKEDFEEAKPGNVYCHLGEWKGSPPACRDTRCYLKELSFTGLLKSERVYLRSGETFEPECAVGFNLARAENHLVTCTGGKWQGHFPPCVVAPCLQQPPLTPHGSVSNPKPSYLHSSRPVYECDEFYFEKVPSTVQCLYGNWTGSPPSCLDSSCYIENLREKTGVDTSTVTVTRSRERIVVWCLDGYRIKSNAPICINGEWKEAQSSPCKESPCFAETVSNGALTEQEVVRGFLGWSSKVVFKKMMIGSPQRKPVFLTCDKGYGFRGHQRANNIPLQCLKGKWHPQPVCLTIGSKYEEPTTQTFPSISGRKLSTSSVLRSIMTTSTTSKPTSVFQDTDSENKDLVTAPSCFCEYPLEDKDVVAHAEDQLLKFGSLVRKGSTVYFHCLNVGYSRLVGPTKIICEDCGKWEATSLPFCQDPKSGDTEIAFARNVRVTPEGYLQIQKGDSVRFHCLPHGVAEYPVWSGPKGVRVSVFNQEVLVNGLSVPSTNLDVLNASAEHEGTYSCRIKRFQPNNVTLIVTDLVGNTLNSSEINCAKLEEDELLRITYSLGLSVSSRAAFHCITGAIRKGASYALCQPNGTWSQALPTCEIMAQQNIAMQHCSLDDLQRALPQGANHTAVNDTLPAGYSTLITCEDNLLLSGRPEATCLKNGTWDFDDVECISGCALLDIPQDSKIIIDPTQENYEVGDLVTFDCPAGHVLTPNIELMMCLEKGWSNINIPECKIS
ncbi:sushi, von Willebrand factor type A, EGF and pentraxin domain-containing protein 1-like [Uloborus diversus]|uniref:sushi, von Willebrand factor type A, EGF and pentraxin domain-containing protein 1-like n=1 Tax=Uloborus diversus TaxID=327109 RepID=UPI00240946CA|nr:sushi, von Willebrand factor type A, EGF and pentraxin domain-containing protein 1-like [Uloborus diversus]